MTDIDSETIISAQAGDADALAQIIRGLQDRVYQLSLRMLANPAAAQDATQDILIRIVTKLSTYRHESSLQTWTYRVATNYLLTARKAALATPELSFEGFASDLLEGLVDDTHAAPEDHVMLNELRVRCTMAMLLCLDQDHRAAYVLGEVLDLSQTEAAEILDISTANFRKRLSRARAEVQNFTAATCGLASKDAPCLCTRRLPAAQAQGRIGPQPSQDLAQAITFETAQAEAQKVEARLVAAKLQRSAGPALSPRDYAHEILTIVTPIPTT